MKPFLAALFAAAACASVAPAQTAPPSAIDGSARNILTLDQALSRAGINSPATEAAQFGVRAAQAGRTVAGLRPNPTVNADVENVVGTGPYKGLDQSETTVGFALPIELGGKRSARMAVAESRTLRAQIDASAAEADLRLRVTQAYVDALAAQRRLDIAQDQVGVTRENLRVARNRVKGGANSPIDEQRAALLAYSAEAELERARQTVEVSRLTLGQLIGSDQPLALDQAWFDRTRAGAYGPAIPADPDGTLALAAATADLATANAQLRLARSQRIPDVTLSAGTRRLEGTGDQAMVFGISVPLALFNNGAAAVRQANAERNRADALRRQSRLDAAQQIAATRAERDRAATSVRASAPILAASQEAARIARIGYSEGKFDQLALLDAERALLDARTAAIDARSSFHDAEARLARLTTPAAAPAATGN